MGNRVRACGWDVAAPLFVVPPDPPPPEPVFSLLDRFAEDLAEHGDIAKAAAAIRVPAGTGQSLFERICQRLGPQATG